MSILWLLTFGLSASSAADEWGELGAQASKAYPDHTADVAKTLEKARDAQAPADNVSMILARSVDSSVNAEDFMGFVENLTRVSEKGLPTRPFAEKIVEGLAKNVPPPAIEKVLDTKLGTYEAAKEITAAVDGSPQNRELALESVALAMERGVSSKTMREVYSGIKNPGVVYHSSYALADLVSMGFTQEQGKRIVSSGIAAGYLSDNHTVIPQVAANAKKSGRTSEEVAQSMESNLQQGKPLSEIATDLRGKKGGGPPWATGGQWRGKGKGASQGGGGASGRGSGQGHR